MRLSLFVAFALSVFASALPGQPVERVVDGDTIVVHGVGLVRLIGVDTPETVDPRKPVEFFGKEATAFTSRLVLGKTVRLEYDWERKDKYGRTLAYVYLPDGTLLNAEILRQGYGHAYTQYPFKLLEEFRALEREAREAGRGLWAAPTASSRVATPRDDPSTTVYVTRTGTRYHRAGCRHLARSQIPMSLAEAMKRYTPCQVCKPPSN